MSSPYDVQPALAQLHALLRTSFVPGTLAVIYDDVPKLLSDGVPFLFSEYQGGTNERDNYDGSIYPTSLRVWQAEVWVAQALVTETNVADQLTKAFAGTFYEWARQHSDLDGFLGDHGEMACVADRIAVVRSLGNADIYLANVFTLEFEDYIN